jgi:transposase
MKMRVALLALIAICVANIAAAESLEKLADDFWKWRAKYAPFTGDDVNRLERPGGIRDWSRASIDQRRNDLKQFETRWKNIDPSSWPVSQQVDYKLIGSALSRLRWELDKNPRWKRDPNFYIEQTLTALAEALTIPAPYDEARRREILTRIENIPYIVQQGSQNLENPPAPFASVAIQNLDGIRERLRKMASSLAASTTLKPEELNSASERAADALEKFQQQLKEKLPKLPQQTALGRDAYVWFLRNVALVPFTPEELLAMGRQEWNRAVTFETFEKNRNKDVPPLKIADNINDWIRDAADKELSICKFLQQRGILTVPDWVQHYTLRPTPEYLRALGFTENDDFTSPSRLKENCIRYVPEPSENLGYFWRTTAMDPRPITVHEGIPGHYFQLCLSWKHEDPIRRHYYDSGANEGIGFYAEEMMLQAGLFDDSPHTREIIYNFMRLRALRVEVDVKLALGQFTLEQAAKYLQEKVPMDEQTARQYLLLIALGDRDRLFAMPRVVFLFDLVDTP